MRHAVLVLSLLLVACPHSKTDDTSGKKPTTALDAGARLYGEHCASCHGAQAEGSEKAPPLVGAAALPVYPAPTAKKRLTRFRNAKDVAGFITRNMPADDPGSLTAAEYIMILAFVLDKNGVDMHGRTVDMNSLDGIPTHGDAQSQSQPAP